MHPAEAPKARGKGKAACPGDGRTGLVVRAFLREAQSCEVVDMDAAAPAAYPMKRLAPEGVFEVFIPKRAEAFPYELRASSADGEPANSPIPTVSCRRSASRTSTSSTRATSTGSTTSSARTCETRRASRAWPSRSGRPPRPGSRVVGNFNGWDGRYHPMRALGASGVWEIFVPGLARGRAVQVRDPGPARGDPAQDRPLRDLLRGAARATPSDRLRRRRLRLERRRLARKPPRAGGQARPSRVDLRGPSRLLAAQAGGREPPADLPRAGARCSPTTSSRWASPTSR